jgi:C-terminal processing protease CtpA/Prc
MRDGAILVAALIAVAVPLQAQQAATTQNEFTPAQLREDLAVLRSSLEEGHGGFYRYSNEAEMDSVFDRAAQAIVAPMTELEFYRFLAPVVAAVNDGHTGLTGSRELESHVRRQPVLLPFKLAFVVGTPYLHRNYSDHPDVVMGGELLSINGTSTDDVVRTMFSALPSDGQVETSKYRRLESTSTFGDLYSRLFGITTRFELTYRSPGDGSVHSITVAGLTAEELTRRFESRYAEVASAEQDRPPVELTYRDSVPVLTIRTFGGRTISNAGINYAAFLRGTFEELADGGASNLIIDVRNNGGGSDEYGKLLAAYLIDDTFDYYRYLEVNSDSFAFFEHTGMSNGDLPRDRFQANERGRYDFVGHTNLGPQQPLEPSFKGDVYILINGASFSATGEFTSVVHHHQRATFIGEECGAGYYGNTSGMMVLMELPNSGLRVRIPLVRYTMAVSGYEPVDRGLIPEHHVEPTIDDVLAGRDAVMEYAIDLIRR